MTSQELQQQALEDIAAALFSINATLVRIVEALEDKYGSDSTEVRVW